MTTPAVSNATFVSVFGDPGAAMTAAVHYCSWPPSQQGAASEALRMRLHELHTASSQQLAWPALHIVYVDHHPVLPSHMHALPQPQPQIPPRPILQTSPPCVAVPSTLSRTSSTLLGPDAIAVHIFRVCRCHGASYACRRVGSWSSVLVMASRFFDCCVTPTSSQRLRRLPPRAGPHVPPACQNRDPRPSLCQLTQG